MKVLVVGSGAREHALAWKLMRDGADVLVAAGNGGTPAAQPVAVSDLAGLTDLAERERVDLTIVGPEAPLAEGIVDLFASRGLRAFGPTGAAAQIEASKAFAKEFMLRHAIANARAEVVSSDAALRHAVARVGLPIVLKADGLAGGKGVFVITDRAGIEQAIVQLKELGAAAQQVLVEEYLDGPEVSVLAFSDGERLALMPPARDYKRVGDDDTGPNTGGMGGYTHPSYMTPRLLDEITRAVLEPTVAGMAAEGVPFKGVLYAGLMLTVDGPKVLEFNCRFGDPECELILPLLESSLVEICEQVIDGALEPRAVRWTAGRTYGVVLAAAGYPSAPRAGDPISGLDAVPEGVLAFHAGTAQLNGQIVTSGGRVLALVGPERASVYAAAGAVQFEGKQYRRDIGLELAGVAR